MPVQILCNKAERDWSVFSFGICRLERFPRYTFLESYAIGVLPSLTHSPHLTRGTGEYGAS